MCIWKQWKKIKTNYRNLKKLGLKYYQVIKFSNTRKGYWRKVNLKESPYTKARIHGGVRGRKIK